MLQESNKSSHLPIVHEVARDSSEEPPNRNLAVVISRLDVSPATASRRSSGSRSRPVHRNLQYAPHSKDTVRRNEAQFEDTRDELEGSPASRYHHSANKPLHDTTKSYALGQTLVDIEDDSERQDNPMTIV
jgi:hypothetical protein